MIDSSIDNTLFLKSPILSAATAPVIIKEVLTKKQLKEFIDLPYRLYKGNKFYLPQLKKDVKATFDKSTNPAFDFCEAKYWLAYKNNRLVGRIAAVINYSFIEKWQNKYMRFGWIEFEQDSNIATALLNKVEEWAMEKGMSAVHGPLGFTNFDYAGLLIEGFDQLGTFATIYNYPYYASFIENAGYKKDVDWLEFKIKLPELMPEKLEKIARIVEKRLDLKVVKIRSKKDVIPYAKELFTLMNASYAELYGMVPLNERQIAYNTKKYLGFIRPDFVSLVLDKNGALAAFGISMPSMALALQKANGHLFPFGIFHILKAFRKNDLGDLALIAVRKDLQGKGVNALLMHDLTKSYIKNGIKYAESNPELETNTKVQSLWEYYDTVQHKRRRCFIKHLINSDEKKGVL
jgi:GNAT superfamily N-acetyltransferase